MPDPAPRHGGALPPDPAPARASATVLLLRDGPRGLEVLMLRRHAGAAFAGDMWVFPGGAVDDADRRLDPPLWTGIDPAALTGRFGAPADLVLGFHVAAVRETFEEAGVLLARDPVGRMATDATLPAGAAGRPAGADFARWLGAAGLVLPLDALHYWSRWVTPVQLPKRFDTCFFVALAPAGQVADHDRVEVTDGRWLVPADALEAERRGDLALMFPTTRTLEELCGFDHADDVVAAARRRRTVRSVQPHAEPGPDGPRLLHPDDPDYPHHLYRAAGR